MHDRLKRRPGNGITEYDLGNPPPVERAFRRHHAIAKRGDNCIPHRTVTLKDLVRKVIGFANRYASL
jgi:hypothetical protein